MPDASQIFPIPFVPGIREDTDRTMLPAGSLVAATNVRTRKGGIGKANELVDANGTHRRTSAHQRRLRMPPSLKG